MQVLGAQTRQPYAANPRADDIAIQVAFVRRPGRVPDGRALLFEPSAEQGIERGPAVRCIVALVVASLGIGQLALCLQSAASVDDLTAAI